MGGRVFSFFMLFLGLGVVSVPSAIMASALTQTRQEEDEEEVRDGL